MRRDMNLMLQRYCTSSAKMPNHTLVCCKEEILVSWIFSFCWVGFKGVFFLRTLPHMHQTSTYYDGREEKLDDRVMKMYVSWARWVQLKGQNRGKRLTLSHWKVTLSNGKLVSSLYRIQVFCVFKCFGFDGRASEVENEAPEAREVGTHPPHGFCHLNSIWGLPCLCKFSCFVCKKNRKEERRKKSSSKRKGGW